MEKVIAVSEFEENSVQILEQDDIEIAVFNVDGSFFAIDSECPHQGGPLKDGKIEDDTVYCPWHGFQFDLETGKHLQSQMYEADTFEVEIKNGDVYVDV